MASTFPRMARGCSSGQPTTRGNGRIATTSSPLSRHLGMNHLRLLLLHLLLMEPREVTLRQYCQQEEAVKMRTEAFVHVDSKGEARKLAAPGLRQCKAILLQL